MLQHRDEVGDRLSIRSGCLTVPAAHKAACQRSSIRSQSAANFRTKLLTCGSCRRASNSCWKSEIRRGH